MLQSHPIEKLAEVPLWSSWPCCLAYLFILQLALMPLYGQPRMDIVTDHVVCGSQKVRVERFEPKAKGQYPAVLLLPGVDGVHSANEYFYRGAARSLADRGFVVLIVHYRDDVSDKAETKRLMEGFRSALLQPEREDAARKQLRVKYEGWCATVRASLAHARKLNSVHGERVGIVGMSLGGFLASSVAMEPEQRVKAVTTLFAGMTPEASKQVKHFPPSLILTGDKDTVVPSRLSHHLRDLLQAKKTADANLHEYAGVGHGFENGLLAALDAEKRVAGFFKSHLSRND